MAVSGDLAVADVDPRAGRAPRVTGPIAQGRLAAGRRAVRRSTALTRATSSRGQNGLVT